MGRDNEVREVTEESKGGARKRGRSAHTDQSCY